MAKLRIDGIAQVDGLGVEDCTVHTRDVKTIRADGPVVIDVTETADSTTESEESAGETELR